MNKMTVVCKRRKFDIEENAGTVYLYGTSTDKDFRDREVDHPKEMLFAVSPEEASYIAAALRTVLGEDKPLEPIEKVQAE